MNRTGGPVRPRQKYTYATRIPRLTAVLATRSRLGDTASTNSVDLSVRVPGSPSGLALPELHRAGVRGLDGGDEGGAHAVPLELADRRDRRPARAGDRLSELHGVLTGVPHHDGRAEGGLHDEVHRQGPRQAEQDAGVDHGLDEVEE